jgi:hypothetical protein
VRDYIIEESSSKIEIHHTRKQNILENCAGKPPFFVENEIISKDWS